MVVSPKFGRGGPDGSTDRAISEVVGFILIVAILVVTLSLVQVYAVPSQNAQVEFTHSQLVRGDLVGARNAILESKRTGHNVPVRIDMAPEYPARLFTINPPPPATTFRSTENGTITVRRPNGELIDACPITDQTKMLEYEASYREYDASPLTRYENTVIYETYPGNRTRLLSGQSLVEGRTINLIPVLEPFSYSGGETFVFEPRPGQLKETRVVDPILSVPTRLDEGTWEELLSDQADPTDISVIDDSLQVELTGSYLVSCGPVAINQQPPGGSRVPAGSRMNPAEPGDLILASAIVDNQGIFHLTFNNTATEPITVTGARLSFYFETQGRSDPDYADIYDGSVSTSNLLGTVIELGSAVEFSSPVSIAALDERTLLFQYDDTVLDGDYFVLDLTFDSGGRSTYFVGSEADIRTPTPTATPTPTPTPTATPTPTPDNQPPTASFTWTRQNQNFVDLDGSASSDPDGSIVSYQWDIGADGTIDGTGQTFSGARVPSGTQVTLTVTDDGGATDAVTQTVT